MRRSHLLFTAAIGLMVLPVRAQQPVGSQAVVASEPGKAGIAQTMKISATITALNKAKREITLKGPKGNTLVLVADERVKNFAQLKVGDVVNAEFVESLTLELRKAGSAPATKGAMVSEGAVGAKAGQKPGGMAVQQITAMAKIIALDEKAMTITLVGPEGQERILPVKNPDHFKVAAVGDQVEVTYTVALAMAVEPAAKKAAPKKGTKPAPKKEATK